MVGEGILVADRSASLRPEWRSTLVLGSLDKAVAQTEENANRFFIPDFCVWAGQLIFRLKANS